MRNQKGKQCGLTARPSAAATAKPKNDQRWCLCLASLSGYNHGACRPLRQTAENTNPYRSRKGHCSMFLREALPVIVEHGLIAECSCTHSFPAQAKASAKASVSQMRPGRAWQRGLGPVRSCAEQHLKARGRAPADAATVAAHSARSGNRRRSGSRSRRSRAVAGHGRRRGRHPAPQPCPHPTATRRKPHRRPKVDASNTDSVVRRNGSVSISVHPIKQFHLFLPHILPVIC